MLRNSCKASHSIIVRTWEYNLYIFSDVFFVCVGALLRQTRHMKPPGSDL